jgi:hypothetical protein
MLCPFACSQRCAPLGVLSVFCQSDVLHHTLLLQKVNGANTSDSTATSINTGLFMATVLRKASLKSSSRSTLNPSATHALAYITTASYQRSHGGRGNKSRRLREIRRGFPKNDFSGRINPRWRRQRTCSYACFSKEISFSLLRTFSSFFASSGSKQSRIQL